MDILIEYVDEETVGFRVYIEGSDMECDAGLEDGKVTDVDVLDPPFVVLPLNIENQILEKLQALLDGRKC